MDIMSLDRLAQEIGGLLPLIAGMGSSLVESTGFVLMNVKVPCVQGYDEDQVALVIDDPGMTECPVTQFVTQGGCSSSGVGSSALSESVLEALLICSWTC